MSTNSKIEWTEHTANLWWGCTKVHAGCDHCYAETLVHRRKPGTEIWGPGTARLEIKGVWKDLDKQQRDAAKAGTQARVFVGSMMDIFEKPMPTLSENVGTGNLRQRLFKNITDGQYPNLIFLFLTKRPSNIERFIPYDWQDNGPPDNVMFGTSPCDQATFDTLVPQLLKVNGKRFLSIEPLLGPIKMRWPAVPWSTADISWVIVGGESGHQARPMHPEWVRDLREQCRKGGVPFFFKQWGEWSPGPLIDKPTDKMVAGQEDGTYCPVWKVGKKEAGRILDGNTYSDFPWELFEPAIPGL